MLSELISPIQERGCCPRCQGGLEARQLSVETLQIRCLWCERSFEANQRQALDLLDPRLSRADSITAEELLDLHLALASWNAGALDMTQPAA